MSKKRRKTQREEYKDKDRLSRDKDNLYLHANDGIDEKQHGDEQTDIRKSLQDKSHVKLTEFFFIISRFGSNKSKNSV